MADCRWVAVVAPLMVAGAGVGVLQQRQRSRRRHIGQEIPSEVTGSDEGEDDGSNQLVTGLETDHTSHGTQLDSDNHQPRQETWCEVTNPDDVHRAVKAPPQPLWRVLDDDKKMINGMPHRLVYDKKTQRTFWLRSKDVQFVDANGYNLRPRK